MITLFNILWTNLNLSGILNWPLLPWCQLMKNSWNQLGKTLVAWNQMVSSTMVHTFWNPSLQNHKSSWIKNPDYYDKKNVHIDTVKLTYFDGSDQDYLARNFSDGNLSTARLFPTSSTYSTIEKKFKDNIVYSPQDSTVYYAYFNVNRQNYGHTKKTSDEQKNNTKTALQNKTSVKLWTLL